MIRRSRVLRSWILGLTVGLLLAWVMPSAGATATVKLTRIGFLSPFIGGYDLARCDGSPVAKSASGEVRYDTSARTLSITLLPDLVDSISLSTSRPRQGAIHLSGHQLVTDIGYEVDAVASFRRKSGVETVRVVVTRNINSTRTCYELTRTRAPAIPPVAWNGPLAITLDDAGSSYSASTVLDLSFGPSGDSRVGGSGLHVDPAFDSILGFGSCHVDSRGRFQCDAGHPAVPGTSILRKVQRLRLAGRLTAGPRGIVGSGIFVLIDSFNMTLTSGTWLASAVP